MSNQVVTASITGANQFTAAFKAGRFPFNVSVSGTFVATVTVQRSFDAGQTWLDVDTRTAPQEAVVEPVENIPYRIGVKTGDYTSGTVEVRLSY